MISHDLRFCYNHRSCVNLYLCLSVQRLSKYAPLSFSHPPVRNNSITCPSYCVKFASCLSFLLECKSGHRVRKFISFCLKWPLSCLFWTGSWMLVYRVSMNAAGQSAITARLVSKCSKSSTSPHRLNSVRLRWRHWFWIVWKCFGVIVKTQVHSNCTSLLFLSIIFGNLHFIQVLLQLKLEVLLNNIFKQKPFYTISFKRFG